MDVILVLNAGSSSLKFQIFAIAPTGPDRLYKGQIDGIGVHPRFRVADRGGAALLDQSLPAAEVPDLAAATGRLRQWLVEHAEGMTLRAIGHRVVHGGPDHDRAVQIDADVLKTLEGLQDLAPLHQPNNLAPIRMVMAAAPEIVQVACFDRCHAPVADCYAIPAALHAEGVRRYGFHGLSYEYIADRLHAVAPDVGAGRAIVAHLGSGASMCAIEGGRSVESTMGFTALDGLPMGTRPGQLDPGVVLYLIGQKGMSAAEVSDLLYKQSGLKGLSGVSNDMRDLLVSTDPRAAFAIDHFVHRCALSIGALTAALGGLDALIFTAGIGENAPQVRARIAARLGWLGAEMDAAANERNDTVISTPGSKLRLMVIPTDEELMIARQTLALLD
jgi:acetate kinase